MPKNSPAERPISNVDSGSFESISRRTETDERGAPFTPAAPTIIMPDAAEVAEHSARSQRGRQVAAAPKKGRELPGIKFPAGLGEEHRRRHLEMLGSVLPTPTGYNLNVVMFSPPEKSEGGIIVPGGSLREYRYQGKVGLVVGVGPDAYQDTAKFPSGPWCKLHDWVIFPAYLDTSRKFTWYGEGGMVDIIVMHDDKIDGVIDDPVLVT